MTLTTEDLQAIKSLFTPEMRDMKSEIQDMKSDIHNLDERVTNVETKLTETRLHLENHTDHHIQLLAENFGELIDKLNIAIPAADKMLLFEVKIDHLYR